MNNNNLDKNLDKKLDPNLEKFIENVKAEFDHVTYKHRLNLSRELKKLSLSSENAKNNQDKSSPQNVSNADKLLDLELKISESLEKYKALFENRKNSLPKTTYDEALPVAQKHDEIIEAIKNNHVFGSSHGGSAVTNPPSNSEDEGLIPGVA